MAEALSQIETRPRVANRAIRARLVAVLAVLGQIEGTRAAAAAAFDPRAVRRRRFVSAHEPTASQASSTRRALAKLMAAGVIVGAGRRGRRTVYRLRKDAELFNSLSLGTHVG
jgi:hypothetical protein